MEEEDGSDLTSVAVWELTFINEGSDSRALSEVSSVII